MSHCLIGMSSSISDSHSSLPSKLRFEARFPGLARAIHRRPAARLTFRFKVLEWIGQRYALAVPPRLQRNHLRPT